MHISSKQPTAHSVLHTQTYTTSRPHSVMCFDFTSKKSESNCVILIGDMTLFLCFQCPYRAVKHLLRHSQTRPDSAVSASILSYWNLSLFLFFFLKIRTLRSSLTAGCLGSLCRGNCRGRRKITVVGDNETVPWLDLNTAWCDCYQSVDEWKWMSQDKDLGLSSFFLTVNPV